MQNVELMQIEAVGAFARRCHDAMTRSRSWTVTVACAEIKLSSNRPAYCHGPLVDINTDSCERPQNLERVDKRIDHGRTGAAAPTGRVLRALLWEAGTGLGLALTKSFAEMHGGRFSIASEVGKGTMVSFYLPVSKTTTSSPSIAMA